MKSNLYTSTGGGAPYISPIADTGLFQQHLELKWPQIGPIKHRSGGEERARSAVGAKRSSIQFHNLNNQAEGKAEQLSEDGVMNPGTPIIWR